MQSICQPLARVSVARSPSRSVKETLVPVKTLNWKRVVDLSSRLPLVSVIPPPLLLTRTSSVLNCVCMNGATVSVTLRVAGS